MEPYISQENSHILPQHVYVCLSSGDLFIFSVRVSAFFSYFCVITLIFPFHVNFLSVSTGMYMYFKISDNSPLPFLLFKCPNPYCHLALTHSVTDHHFASDFWLIRSFKMSRQYVCTFKFAYNLSGNVYAVHQ